MNKSLRSFLLAFLCACALCLPATALESDDIGARYAVLMDAKTGQVLYDKNMRDQAYPASMTKIMTAVLALENSYPGETVTVSESAVALPYFSSHIALASGEKTSMRSALYAMMLPSANDAANVVAEHVSGSQKVFAELMTSKARLIGAADTRFLNAHGLHEDGHYTTAYDMAQITRYAIQTPGFMEYFGAQTYSMPPTNLQASSRPFTNYQYMVLPSSRYYNPDVVGGKVGYTTEAGHTMSTVAERDGRTLICVLIQATKYGKFQDTDALLEYGFTEFASVELPATIIPEITVPVRQSGAEVGSAVFSAKSSISVLLRNDMDADKIIIRHGHPEYFEQGSRLQASASLFMPDAAGTLPSLLGTFQLRSSVSLDESLMTGADRNRSGSRAVSWQTVLAALLIFTGFALLIAVRREQVRQDRRRKARMARLNHRARTPRRIA